MSRPLNLVLFGSDQFSLVCFSKLYESKDIAYIYKTVTPPMRDKRHFLPLRKFCESKNFDLENAPIDKKSMPSWMPDWLSQPKVPLDLAVVVSFGYFIPLPVLQCFKYGGINVHPSLLPKYRGSAPIEHTILNGDTETGVSIIGLHSKTFDAGNILNQCKIKVPDKVRYPELHSILATQGADLLYKTLTNFDHYQGVSISQDEKQVTKAPKLLKKSAVINWKQSSATQVDRTFRAISHRYGLETMLRDKRFILLDISLGSPSKTLENLVPGSIVIEGSDPKMFVKCLEGWIQVLKLKMINKNPTGIAEFVNGHGIDVNNSSDQMFI